MSGFPPTHIGCFFQETSSGGIGICVKIFDGDNFDGGWEREFGVGDYMYGSDFPNDALSSLKVMPGCRVDLWPSGPTGPSDSFGPGDYNKAAFVAAGGTDNEVSSMKVRKFFGGISDRPMAFFCRQ